MVQSLNKAVEFHTTGTLTLEWGERLKILVGMPLLNFMRMLTLKITIQILANRANRSQCIDVKLAAIFEIYTQ